MQNCIVIVAKVTYNYIAFKRERPAADGRTLFKMFVDLRPNISCIFIDANKHFID